MMVSNSAGYWLAMLLIVCQLNRYVSDLMKTLNVIGVFRTKVPVTFKIDSLDYEQSLSHSVSI